MRTHGPNSQNARSCALVAVLFAALALNSCGGKTPTEPTPAGLSAPTLAAPQDDAIAATRPVLTVHNATSGSTTPRTYDFQVSDSQASLTDAAAVLLVSVTGIAEGAGDTTYTVDRALQPGTRYYWRSRAVQSGVSGPWSSTFRFRMDTSTNTPPIIVSLTPGSLRNDANAEIELRAVVQDQETSLDALTYQWASSSGGTFIGTGAVVRWHAPSVVTAPGTTDLTLTVIERYLGGALENRVSATTTIHVNDSPREVTAMAMTFLDDFIHSDRTPEFCVRNFTDSCDGKADELGDIQSDRAQFVIDPARSTIGTSPVDFYDSGSVISGKIVPPGQSSFAVMLVPCSFGSTRKSTGEFGTSVGTCKLTAVYENWKWFLCTSSFIPSPGIAQVRGFRF